MVRPRLPTSQITEEALRKRVARNQKRKRELSDSDSLSDSEDEFAGECSTSKDRASSSDSSKDSSNHQFPVCSEHLVEEVPCSDGSPSREGALHSQCPPPLSEADEEQSSCSDVDPIPFFQQDSTDEDGDDISIASLAGNEEWSDDEPLEDTSSVRNFLTEWAFSSNINHQQLSQLCRGLRQVHSSCFFDLPLDARTYFKTPRSKVKSRVMESIDPEKPGKYVHIGVEKQLLSIIPFIPDSLTSLDLFFNVDGLPLVKSKSKGELWPILMKVISSQVKCAVMPVGMYSGSCKPGSNIEYLQEFVDELVPLCSGGVKGEKKVLTVRAVGIACDVPAKSFVLGTIGHNGFYSCSRCVVQGESLGKRRIFKDLDCPLRNDADFRARVYEDYCPASRDTLLTKIPHLDMIKSISLDYMHLVLLGVMKKLLLLWFGKGTKQSMYRLSAAAKLSVSEDLSKLRYDTPMEFKRKPYDLQVVGDWKATEYRLFLLYLGPTVLKDVLTAERYNHFILLHLAITILVSRRLCRDPDQRDYSRRLLRQFVSSIENIYDESLLVHNVHCLIHLPDDIDHFDSLIPNCTIDSLSAFPFENHMQELKKISTRGYAKRLEQADRRIAEAMQSEFMKKQKVTVLSNDVKFERAHRSGPLLAMCQNPQFRSITYQDYEIRTDYREDSFCGLNNGDVIKIENVAYCTSRQCTVVIGRLLLGKGDLYSDVCSSSLYGILKCNRLSPLQQWPVDEIMCKYLCFNHKNNFILYPLIHSVS